MVAVKTNPLDALRLFANEQDPKKRGAIYCAELRTFTSGTDVIEVLASNSLGTVTSDLIILKALDFLKVSFPVLSRITTDFSAKNVKFGSPVRTRLVSVPTVGTYSTSTGYGRSDVTTSDVTITINQHKHVTIGFNANELAGTGRDLFAEQVEAMHYALGKDLVEALYALFVIGTYTNATTVATASITRKTLPLAVAGTFNGRGVPQAKRTLLLSSAAFAQLSEDPSIVNLAAFSRPELIEEYQLPRLSGLQPIEAVNLPTTGNMTGFAFTPDAAAIATRLPEDYTKVLPGASHGSVTTVTNPDTGLSVLKTEYVDHILGAGYSRVAWMYGVAAGNPLSGQIIKSS